MSEVDDFFSQLEESKEISFPKAQPPEPIYIKMGRPTTFHQGIADEICMEIAVTKDGNRDVCERLGVPYRTFMGWLMNNTEFQLQYARAKEFQMDDLVDSMLTIADEDVGENMAAANMRKLKVDVIKFISSKLKPKVYGDRKEVDVTVTQAKVLNDDQFNKLLNTVSLNQQEVIEDIEHEDVDDTESFQD